MPVRYASILLSLFFLLCGANAKAQSAMTWREVSPENLVYMELALAGDETGLVIIELNPRFAPETVKQFRRLVEEGFYRGLSFYRVIDGFVAQGGDGSDIASPNGEPTLPAEFEIRADEDLPWTRVEEKDLYQAETGFTDGFAAARDGKSAWLTHCPGVIAMARGNEPESGSTDFYIVIGQAPRYLDRNLAIFGRVVHGMDQVQRIRRGLTEENGIIADDTRRTRIRNMRLGTKVEEPLRKAVYVMDTGSKGFSEFMAARRDRKDAFFHHHPPEVLDVCQVPVGTRVEKPNTPIPPRQ